MDIGTELQNTPGIVIKQLQFEDGRHQIFAKSPNGEDLGNITVAPYDFAIGSDGTSAIFDVFTNRTARGKGVGSKLLQEAESWARVHGFKSLRGDFSPDIGIEPTGLREFYEKNGFQVIDGVVSKIL